MSLKSTLKLNDIKRSQIQCKQSNISSKQQLFLMIFNCHLFILTDMLHLS